MMPREHGLVALSSHVWCFSFAKDQGLQVSLFVRQGVQLSQNLLSQIQTSAARVYQYVDKKWVDVTAETLKKLKN
jgi:hypothetical protein